MKLTEAEFLDLTSAKSETEWNDACNRVKAARGGQYPPDWWPRMALSGAMARTFAKWSKP